MKKRFKEFKLLGRDFAFTYIGDNISMYSFGAKHFVDGKLVKDTSIGQYWHKLCFGIYIRSDSWLVIR